MLPVKFQARKATRGWGSNDRRQDRGPQKKAKRRPFDQRTLTLIGKPEKEKRGTDRKVTQKV